MPRPRWPAKVWEPTSSTFEYLPVDHPFSGGINFPAPDTEPFPPALRSTAQLTRDLNGSVIAVYPQKRFAESPFTLLWTMQSGSLLKEQLQSYIESGAGLQFTPHTGVPFSGILVEFQPSLRPSTYDGGVGGRVTTWDIRASFQPMNVQSGT